MPQVSGSTRKEALGVFKIEYEVLNGMEEMV